MCREQRARSQLCHLESSTVRHPCKNLLDPPQLTVSQGRTSRMMVRARCGRTMRLALLLCGCWALPCPPAAARTITFSNLHPRLTTTCARPPLSPPAAACPPWIVVLAAQPALSLLAVGPAPTHHHPRSPTRAIPGPRGRYCPRCHVLLTLLLAGTAGGSGEIVDSHSNVMLEINGTFFLYVRIPPPPPRATSPICPAPARSSRRCRAG